MKSLNANAPTPTHNYRRQHQNLLQLAGDMTTQMGQDPVNWTAVRRTFAQMLGALEVHLAMEDEVLYPRLLAHPDESIRAKARTFQDEMGGLKKAVAALAERWSTAADMTAAPDAARKDLLGMLSTLARRVEREDNDLYVVVDCVGH